MKWGVGWARNCAWALTRRSEQLQAMERISFLLLHSLRLVPKDSPRVSQVGSSGNLDRPLRFSSVFPQRDNQLHASSTARSSHPVKFPACKERRVLSIWRVLASDAVEYGKNLLILRRNILSPSSGSKSGERADNIVFPAYSSSLKIKADGTLSRNVSKRLHGVTFQKLLLFIVSFFRNFQGSAGNSLAL
jgi:hypothetical protein